MENRLQYQKTRRADPDKKWLDERMRRLRKFATGIVPQPRILVKYEITIETVNAIRRDNNYPPLDTAKYDAKPFETMTTTALGINKDTLKHIEKVAKQAAVKLHEEKELLKKTQDALKAQYKYKFVGIPEEDRYSVKQIMNYYTKHESIDPKTRAPRAPTTMRIVYGIHLKYNTEKQTPDTKIQTASWNGLGNLANTISRLGKKYMDDTSLIFDDMKKLFDTVEGIKEANVSKQGRLQHLNVLFKEYPGYQIVEAKRKAAVELMNKEIDDKYSPSVQSDKAKRKLLSVVEDFDTIVNKVERRFGKTSEEYLYMKVFEEVPSRDDFGSMKVLDVDYNYMLNPNKIKADLKAQIETLSEDKYNLLIMGNQNAMFYFTSYKTAGKYGNVFYPCSKALYKLIIAYMVSPRYNYRIEGEFLFKSKNMNMKQSAFVGNMLVKSGVKEVVKVANQHEGSINLLRHSWATKELSKLDPNNKEQFNNGRIRISHLMRHSVEQTDTYLSTVKK